MPKLMVGLTIGLASGDQTDVIDIDDGDWDACNDDDEREKLMDEACREWANNYIETWRILMPEAEE